MTSVSSKTRQTQPIHSRTQSRDSKHVSSPTRDDDHQQRSTLNFGTSSQLIGTTSTPPSKGISPQTPSHSLSGRTRETLARLTKDRQPQSAQKSHSKPTKSTSTNNAFAKRNTPPSSTPASGTRAQQPSASSPSRSPVRTPVASVRASTPATPSSRRTPRTVAASTGNTPTSVRTTSAGSSIAVRDAIRRAKQEHKLRSSTPPIRNRRIDYTDETSFDDIDNPFNLSPGTPPIQTQLRRAIETGRTTGNLNISNLELREIPEDVYTMYDLSSKDIVVDFSSKSSGWYESVDLERFNAAGNEISEIHERIVDEFPGIRHFDMHANKLSALPPRFERLGFMRTLNLSKNSLTSASFDSICQLTSLIELYLSHNEIEGPLTSCIAALKELQILDIEGNRITSLPDNIIQLRRMRILLLGENHIGTLPWKAFEGFGDLYQLDVSSNKLCDHLVPPHFDEITLPCLSSLDIHSNLLTLLPSNLHLPSLTQFNASQNELSETGTFFTTTPRLVHLSLAQNQLSALPDGVIHLAYLRTLDVSNNIIEHIDPRLGLLDNLTTFMWMGNLVRQRAWGSMDTEGIKSALRAKADEAALKGLNEDLADLKVNATCRGECAGIVNLTGKLKETPLTEEMIKEHVHANHFPILSKVVLQQNKLVVAPMEVSIVAALTSLDLSKNALTSKVFDQPITLQNLAQLDLSVNIINTLEHLPAVILAPALKSLDVSFNSLVTLFPLHQHYPTLTTLYANSNRLSAIIPTDVEGLEIVQVNNNSINKLLPELGLVESLRVLGVDGNTFRVPSRRVVEQGSAALLEWLRGRCAVPY